MAYLTIGRITKFYPGKTSRSVSDNPCRSLTSWCFLLSYDFIKSDECYKEWEYAKELSQNKNKEISRIPIILRPCSWQDFLGNDKLQALPNDAQPVVLYEHSDIAWNEVYEGIKSVINDLRNNFTSKIDFLSAIHKPEIPSLSQASFEDLYVFPRMTRDDPGALDMPLYDTLVSSREEILKTDFLLIHGQEKSGKTSLARHLFLSFVEQLRPVLLMDAMHIRLRNDEELLHQTYSQQFHGDYLLWREKQDKVLIVDNMGAEKTALDFIELARAQFGTIILVMASDVYYSYFMDEERFADFLKFEIEPLTQRQQEQLIRARLTYTDNSNSITDGFIDQVENRVNSIVVSDKIVPRYPFYVLSILETYETYMPSNMFNHVIRPLLSSANRIEPNSFRDIQQRRCSECLLQSCRTSGICTP